VNIRLCPNDRNLDFFAKYLKRKDNSKNRGFGWIKKSPLVTSVTEDYLLSSKQQDIQVTYRKINN
jgi:hypothetical protein